MELYYPQQHSSAWPFFLLAPYYSTAAPHNYVHWTETPDSHLFSADLPGVRKEEIRVEVEDSLYLVIRTEFGEGGDGDEGTAAEREKKRSFMRKFRLPRLVDLEGIAAAYEHGVLTVTVPRSASRRRLGLAPEDVAEARSSVARAA